MTNSSNCEHLERLLGVVVKDLWQGQDPISCVDCGREGLNLWICLKENCLHIGCSENRNDHSATHYKNNPYHCVRMNLVTERIWCYECKREVFLPSVFNQPCETFNSNQTNATQSLIGNNSTYSGYRKQSHMFTGIDRGTRANASHFGDSQDSSCHTDDDGVDGIFDGKPRGLVGLQNIGNTCYMNSAIQALSNTPPLTQYFLDCGASVQFLTETKKPGLSRPYQKLVKEIWNKRTRGYVVPNGILYGVRNVNPMFRGYQQHDTQEFLRCFMDQLHEELKEPIREDRQVSSSQSESGYVARHQESSNQVTPMNGTSQQKSGRISDNCENSNRRLYRSQKSPARSSDNISSANKGYFRMHSASESTGNVSSFDNDRRSASFCDSRGYASFSQEFDKAEENPSGNNTLNDIRCERNEIINAGDDDDDDEDDAYETCDSGVSESSSLNEEELRPSKGYKRKNDSDCAERRVSNSLERETNSGGGDRSPPAPPTYKSIISDIFDGRLLSSVQCLTCDRISTRVETFQDLSLPIPSRDHMAVLHGGAASNGSQQSQSNGSNGRSSIYSVAVVQEGWVWWLLGWLRSWIYGPAVTLHNCLAAFFSADELKGDNMYSCEKCNKLRNGVKFSKVLGLPEVLCVHLKRFRHELMSSSKIGAKVSFPLSGLDMRPYLHKDCTSAVSTYDLVAVICHTGSAGGGHYTCVARNRHTAQWFEFDDQYVTGFTPEQVTACEAYVLFYKKTNHRMTGLRQKALELLETFNELNDIKFYISKQWINRFNTYAEPGPIDNCDFVCPHGGVCPERLTVVERLTTVVSQPLWEFFYENFGGGPACNHLHACSLCRTAAEQLRKRQRTELQNFTIQHHHFGVQESVSPIYAISMNWFRCWQAFAHNKTQQPPPPIDNSDIIVKTPLQDSNSSSKSLTTSSQPTIRPSADLAQFNEEVWRFFHGVYGGGPEVKLKSAPNYSQYASSVQSSSQGYASNSTSYSQLPEHGYRDNYDASSQGGSSSTGQYRQLRNSESNFDDSRRYIDKRGYKQQSSEYGDDSIDDTDEGNTRSLSHIDLYDSERRNRNVNNFKSAQSLQDVSLHNNNHKRQTNVIKMRDSQRNISTDSDKQSVLVETGDGTIQYSSSKVYYSKDASATRSTTPLPNTAKLNSNSSIDVSRSARSKLKPGKAIRKSHAMLSDNARKSSSCEDSTSYPSGYNSMTNDLYRQESDKDEHMDTDNSCCTESNVLFDDKAEYNRRFNQCGDSALLPRNRVHKGSYNAVNDAHISYSNTRAVSSSLVDLPNLEKISLRSKSDMSKADNYKSVSNSYSSLQNNNNSSNSVGNKGNSKHKKGTGRKLKRQLCTGSVKKVNSGSASGKISSQENANSSVPNGGEKFAK